MTMISVSTDSGALHGCVYAGDWADSLRASGRFLLLEGRTDEAQNVERIRTDVMDQIIGWDRDPTRGSSQYPYQLDLDFEDWETVCECLWGWHVADVPPHQDSLRKQGDYLWAFVEEARQSRGAA